MGCIRARLWVVPLLLIAGAAPAPRVAAADAPQAEAALTPPGQPEAGPGGQDYSYRQMRTTRYGQGADGYWLFEPADADKTKPLPVIVYVHGLNATPYRSVLLWLNHLVRKGNIVVYPQYQQGLWLDPTTFTDRSAAAVVDALKRLNGNKHARADTDRFALVGHSLGGVIAANLAARPERFGLPVAKAVMAVQPGDVKARRGLGALMPSIMHDHSTIAPGTLMLLIATENDDIVGRDFAKRLYTGASRVDKEDKDYLLIRDDRRGRVSLTADHFMPFAYIDRRGRRRADAFDFALWRWCDALTDAAFYDGRHRGYALGNTPEQRSLGKWSDGTPVREVLVSDEP